MSGRSTPVVGGAEADDGGELSRGMTAAPPTDLGHGDPDGQIGLSQELGQAVGAHMSQVPHGRHPEALAEGPAQR